MRSLTIIVSAAVLTLTASMALAQKAPPKPRTEASLECSKQADAKGLKGKERRKFRSKCKRDFAKAAKAKK